jgi:pimeloyl-ACP methyl ester carboxylesterase
MMRFLGGSATLLIWDAQDRIVPLPFGKALDEAIPNSTLIVMDETGHLPMEERPDKVSKAIHSWKAYSMRVAPDLERTTPGARHPRP